ncbi:MAG: hypothetical protein ACKN9D_11305, partial [Actinomycetales bacterium]
VVPLVLWLGWATVTKRWSQVMAAIVLASLLRPQFILFALILLSMRQWRYLLGAGVLSAALNAVAFALWPGGFTTNISGWLYNISSYSGMVPLERNYPTNLSIAHAVTVLTRAGRILPEPVAGWLDQIQALVLHWPWLPGLGLLAVVGILLLVFGPRLPVSSQLTVAMLIPVLVPSLTFGYYLVVVIPIAAWLLLDPGQWFNRSPGNLRGLLDCEVDNGRGPTVMTAWLVVIAVGLSLVPIPLAIASGENSVLAQNLGLLWTLVVLLLLIPRPVRTAAAPA